MEILSWWFWISLGIILCILEVFITNFIVIFFGIGAILVGILSGIGKEYELFEIGFPTEFLLWSTFSIVTLYIFRKKVIKKLDRDPSIPEPDSLVGLKVKAKEDIRPNESGKVELRGSDWNATNKSDEVIKKGDFCKIQDASNIKLEIVKDIVDN